MSNDSVDIRDLEAFINGLQKSIDTLEQHTTSDSQGFQAQLAKAISLLRIKMVDKRESFPKHVKRMSKEEMKTFLLKELKSLKKNLESEEVSRRKFKLVMQITKLRERISSL
jgi:hypothetical protein